MPSWTFFSVANYAEAVLWLLVGATFIAFALRQGTRGRRRCWIAAVAFIAFGVSDVVEVQTGAWWRPWWLFFWKAACVVTFVALRARYMNAKRAVPRARDDDPPWSIRCFLVRLSRLRLRPAE